MFFDQAPPEIQGNIYFISLFLINILLSFLTFLIYYAYLLAKFFKLLCYTKLTMEWFPMISPFDWPFSICRDLTMPYFRFWATLLPPIRLKDSSIHISTIVGLELMNTMIFILGRIIEALIEYIEPIRDELEQLAIKPL